MSKIRVFEDLGRFPSVKQIGKINIAYMKGTDSSLGDLNITAWLLVLAGNLLTEISDFSEPSWAKESFIELNKKIALVNPDTDIPFLLEKTSLGFSAWTLFVAYAVGIKNTAIYNVYNFCIKNNPGFANINTAEILDNNNAYATNFFHLMINKELNVELEKFIAEGAVSLANQKSRVVDSSIKQMTTSAFMLAMSIGKGEDDRKTGQIHQTIYDSYLAGLEEKDYTSALGVGTKKYNLLQNILNDDLVAIVLSSSHSDLKTLASAESLVGSSLLDVFKLSLDEVVVDGKTTKDLYDTSLRASLSIVEDSSDCPSIQNNAFPSPLEDFFSPESLIENKDIYKQLTLVPAFSYYCHKYRSQVDPTVLYFLWKATVANALSISNEGDVYGTTPLSMLSSCLTIIRGEWNNPDVAKVYKDMIVSLNANNPNTLYMLAMDSTRASRMKDNNYDGGVSNMLKILCEHYGGVQDETTLAILSQQVFPDYVNINTVLDWGKKYGIILELESES